MFVVGRTLSLVSRVGILEQVNNVDLNDGSTYHFLAFRVFEVSRFSLFYNVPHL